MTNLRIGLDVSAEEYWKKRTAYYCSKIDVPYNRHRLKVIAALLNGVDLSGARCVDFGCGEGVMLEEVALAGARVTGKTGPFDVGLLNIQTADKPSAGAVATNFSAIRLKRDVLRRSSIGLIATERLPSAGGGN